MRYAEYDSPSNACWAVRLTAWPCGTADAGPAGKPLPVLAETLGGPIKLAVGGFETAILPGLAKACLSSVGFPFAN